MQNDKQEADVTVGHNGGPSMEPAKVKVEAIDAVLHDRRFNQTEALVLIGLIVRSDDDLTNAVAGGKTLAMYAKKGDKTDSVFKALRRLEDEFHAIQRNKRINGQSNAYCIMPMHVVEAITAEYESLKAEKAKRQPTPPAGVGHPQTYPSSGGRSPCVAPVTPTPYTGAPPNQGRPSSGGGSTLCTPAKKVPCLYTDSNKTLDSNQTDSNPTQDSLDDHLESHAALPLFGEVILPSRKVALADKRGTRLPDDWTLPEEWRVAALKRGLSQQEVSIEAEKFHAYWASKTGKDATKRRWDLTWRTWITNAASWRPKASGGTPSPTHPITACGEPVVTAQDRKDLAALGAERYAAFKRDMRGGL